MTIKLTDVKNGYYASEIVSEMVRLGYVRFSKQSFISFWRDEMKIDKNNTQYGYEMHNKRFVWTENFLELVKTYCSENKDLFEEE